MSRILFLVSVVTTCLVGLTAVGQGATAQDGTPTGLGNLPEGIGIERLADTASLPFASGDTSAGLARYTYGPGARLEISYPGPILAYVETGTLALDAVGLAVSVRQPQQVTVEATPGGGQSVSIRQEAGAPVAGASAEVATGGSIYAPDGALGPTRNPGDEPLVLLVVSFVTQPTTGVMSATAMATTGPLATPTQTP